MKISDLDVFFISYDEPKKELFWSELLRHCPWANRIDGVEGFDAAHKEAARRSTTDRFITIDGDSVVFEEFFFKTLEIPEQYKNHVISWAAKNMINGLIYGNGGIKCWPRDLVLNMNTHEKASSETQKVDFCWSLPYVQMKNCYNWTYPNGSPEQAFRAGFREGVKMCLKNGERIGSEEFDTLWIGNRKRLAAWCSLGADVINGDKAILGARLGAYLALSQHDWDHSTINNRDVSMHMKYCDYIVEEGNTLIGLLRTLIKLPIADFDAEQSKLVKMMLENPVRSQLVFEVE